MFACPPRSWSLSKQVPFYTPTRKHFKRSNQFTSVITDVDSNGMNAFKELKLRSINQRLEVIFSNTCDTTIGLQKDLIFHRSARKVVT
jgi:hypothetical protein